MSWERETWSPNEEPGIPLIRQDMNRLFDEEVIVNYCRKCNAQGVEHEIVEIPDGINLYFGGVPQHTRHCTGCGTSDGPWVKAEYVGCY